jgi:hypothetical protein
MGRPYGVKPQRNMILSEAVLDHTGMPKHHHMFLYSEMSGAEIEAYEKSDPANALLPDLTTTSGRQDGQKQTHWFTGVHFLPAARQPQEHDGLEGQKFYGKIVQREQDPSTGAILYGILPNAAPAHSSEWENVDSSPVVELQLRTDQPVFDTSMPFERAGDHVNTDIEFLCFQYPEPRRIVATIVGVHRNLVSPDDGDGIGVALRWNPELNGGQKHHGLGSIGLNPLSANVWDAAGVKYSPPVWEIIGGLPAANGALVQLRDCLRPLNRVRVGELAIVRWPVEPHDIRRVMVVGIDYADVAEAVMPSVVRHLLITDRSESVVHRIPADYFESAGHGQNLLLRDMRRMYFESSLRFDDSRLSLRLHGSVENEEFLFHERQEAALCGMHAVNNLFQRRIFVFGEGKNVPAQRLAASQWNVPISEHDNKRTMIDVVLRIAKKNRATQLRADVGNGLTPAEASGQAKMTEVEHTISSCICRFG